MIFNWIGRYCPRLKFYNDFRILVFLNPYCDVIVTSFDLRDVLIIL